MHIVLKLLNGEIIERFIEAKTCIIGRSSDCDIIIKLDGMSRKHCEFSLIDGEIYITDLGSLNGVLIDNQKIAPYWKIRYVPYLILSFGAVLNAELSIEIPKDITQINQLNTKPNSKFSSKAELTLTCETFVNLPAIEPKVHKYRNLLNIHVFQMFICILIFGYACYYTFAVMR